MYTKKKNNFVNYFLSIKVELKIKLFFLYFEIFDMFLKLKKDIFCAIWYDGGLMVAVSIDMIFSKIMIFFGNVERIIFSSLYDLW